ncbi:hypothetical protein MTO96_019120 [Rhipicephalus appendiculatus]
MNKRSCVLFLCLFCITIGSSYKLPEKDETLDVVVDKEAERLGVEATQVAQILRAISHGLRETAQRKEGVEDQGDEYFIIDIIKGIGNAMLEGAKGVVNVVDAIAKSQGWKWTETGERMRHAINRARFE